MNCLGVHRGQASSLREFPDISGVTTSVADGERLLQMGRLGLPPGSSEQLRKRSLALLHHVFLSSRQRGLILPIVRWGQMLPHQLKGQWEDGTSA